MKRLLVLLVALAVVGASVAGGVAFAATMNSNEVIQSCYQKKSGALRILIPGGKPCDPKKEVALQWNQTGPQGPEGAIELRLDKCTRLGWWQ